MIAGLVIVYNIKKMEIRMKDYLSRSIKARKALSIKANSFYCSILGKPKSSSPERFEIEIANEEDDDSTKDKTSWFRKNLLIKRNAAELPNTFEAQPRVNTLNERLPTPLSLQVERTRTPMKTLTKSPLRDRAKSPIMLPSLHSQEPQSPQEPMLSISSESNTLQRKSRSLARKVKIARNLQLSVTPPRNPKQITSYSLSAKAKALLKKRNLARKIIHPHSLHQVDIPRRDLQIKSSSSSSTYAKPISLYRKELFDRRR